MIEFKRKNNIVDIIPDEINSDKFYIVLNQNINITQLETILHTGIYVFFDKEYSNCFIIGETESKLPQVYMNSYVMYPDYNGSEITFRIANPLKNNIILPSGGVIGQIYKSFSDIGILDDTHCSGLNIYNDDKISVKSIDNKLRHFELISESNGKQKIIIELN